MNININLGGPPGPLTAMARLITGIVMICILLFMFFWFCIFGSIIFSTDPITFAIYAIAAGVIGLLVRSYAQGHRI